MPSKDGRHGKEKRYSRKYNMRPDMDRKPFGDDRRGYVVENINENGYNSARQQQEEFVYIDFNFNEDDFVFRPKVERPPPRMTAVTREILKIQGDSRMSILDAMVKYYQINKPTDFEWKKRTVVINRYTRKPIVKNEQTSSYTDSVNHHCACDFTNELNDDSSSTVSVSDVSYDSDDLDVKQSQLKPTARSVTSLPTDNFGVIQKYTRKVITKDDLKTENRLKDSLDVAQCCQKGYDSSTINCQESRKVSNDDVEQRKGHVIQRYTRNNLSSSLSAASENDCRTFDNTEPTNVKLNFLRKQLEKTMLEDEPSASSQHENTLGAECSQSVTDTKLSSAGENVGHSNSDPMPGNVKLNFLHKQLAKVTLEDKPSASSRHGKTLEAECGQNVTNPKFKFLKKILEKDDERKNVTAVKSNKLRFFKSMM